MGNGRGASAGRGGASRGGRQGSRKQSQAKRKAEHGDDAECAKNRPSSRQRKAPVEWTPDAESHLMQLIFDHIVSNPFMNNKMIKKEMKYKKVHLGMKAWVDAYLASHPALLVDGQVPRYYTLEEITVKHRNLASKGRKYVGLFRRTTGAEAGTIDVDAGTVEWANFAAFVKNFGQDPGMGIRGTQVQDTLSQPVSADVTRTATAGTYAGDADDELEGEEVDSPFKEALRFAAADVLAEDGGRQGRNRRPPPRFADAADVLHDLEDAAAAAEEAEAAAEDADNWSGEGEAVEEELESDFVEDDDLEGRRGVFTQAAAKTPATQARPSQVPASPFLQPVLPPVVRGGRGRGTGGRGTGGRGRGKVPHVPAGNGAVGSGSGAYGTAQQDGSSVQQQTSKEEAPLPAPALKARSNHSQAVFVASLSEEANRRQKVDQELQLRMMESQQKHQMEMQRMQFEVAQRENHNNRMLLAALFGGGGMAGD